MKIIPQLQPCLIFLTAKNKHIYSICFGVNVRIWYSLTLGSDNLMISLITHHWTRNASQTLRTRLSGGSLRSNRTRLTSGTLQTWFTLRHKDTTYDTHFKNTRHRILQCICEGLYATLAPFSPCLPSGPAGPWGPWERKMNYESSSCRILCI